MIRHRPILYLWLFAAALSRGQPSDGEPLPSQITIAREALEHSTEANPGPPVHLRGIVTCSDASYVLCFLQDGSGGIFLDGISSFPGFGSLIEVKGRVARGLFSPIVLVDSFTEFGNTNLPPPLRTSIDEVITGRHDASWVEVEGVVMRQFEEGTHLVMTLGSGRNAMNARFLNHNSANPRNWVDARVRVRGVAATTPNNRQQIVGFHLLSQSTELISLLDEGREDPFSTPLRSTGNLIAFSVNGVSEHRVRLRGIVSFSWPGRDFFIRDQDGSIHVQSRQTNLLAPGDLVDVVGFRSLAETRPALIEAIYRKAGQGVAPAPRPISPTQALDGEADGEVVSVIGTILQRVQEAAGYSAFILEAEQKVFTACFQDEWALPRGGRLAGAKVQISGLCRLNPHRQGPSESFSIWMRRPDDLAIIAPPPTWKQREMIFALAGIGGAVALAGGWVFLLRLRVRRGSEEMQRRETALEERFRDLYENANDIIYSHDLEGRVISMNNAGQALFGYTEAEFTQMTSSHFLDPEDLEIARQHMRQKLEGNLRSSYELRLRARDGRRLYFDVNSRLLFKNGKPIGVQGIARDITERKVAEEALRVSERQLRASLEERERLARDLHDGIIQSIYAAGLNLEDTIHVVRTDFAAGENRIRKLVADLNQIIREVRGFIMGLERRRFEGKELKAALQALSLAAGESQAALVELVIDDAVATELTADEATQLLQIAREALSNSIRHAHARKLIFELKRGPNGSGRFELSDDGIGFNSIASGEKGFGLRNMATRAQEINADFHIFTDNGAGTRIVLDMRSPTAEKVGA